MTTELEHQVERLRQERSRLRHENYEIRKALSNLDVDRHYRRQILCLQGKFYAAEKIIDLAMHGQPLAAIELAKRTDIYSESTYEPREISPEAAHKLVDITGRLIGRINTKLDSDDPNLLARIDDIHSTRVANLAEGHS
jgi:hypothetical protein